jgi:hypothetical protein
VCDSRFRKAGLTDRFSSSKKTTPNSVGVWLKPTTISARPNPAMARHRADSKIDGYATALAAIEVGANYAAAAAVCVVYVNVGAMTAAKSTTRSTRVVDACPLVTDWARSGADVSAGAAVIRIRIQGGTCPVATGSRRGATDVGSTASTKAVCVAAAGLAGRHTLVPLLLGRARPAKGCASIRPGSPGGPQHKRAEYGARQNGPDAP